MKDIFKISNWAKTLWRSAILRWSKYFTWLIFIFYILCSHKYLPFLYVYLHSSRLEQLTTPLLTFHCYNSIFFSSTYPLSFYYYFKCLFLFENKFLTWVMAWGCQRIFKLNNVISLKVIHFENYLNIQIRVWLFTEYFFSKCKWWKKILK